jgi:hypothetical protein
LNRLGSLGASDETGAIHLRLLQSTTTARLIPNSGGIAGFLTLVFHDPVKGITYFAAGTDLRLDFKPTMLQMVSYINGH